MTTKHLHSSQSPARKSIPIFQPLPAHDQAHIVFTLSVVLLLALLAYSVVYMCLHVAIVTHQSHLHLFLSYALIILGYLLFPGIFIIVARRHRTHARNQLLLSHHSQNVDIQFTPPNCSTPLMLPSSLTALLSNLFSPLKRHVDLCTTRAIHASPQSPDEAHVQCTVCLLDIAHGSQTRVLPCKHTFHLHCIDLWLVNATKNSCPLCWRTVCPTRDTNMLPLRT